jgi:hypothetical protein
MNNDQNNDPKMVVSAKQFKDATLIAWRSIDEFGCEIIGDADQVEELADPRLCFEELRNAPGFDEMRENFPAKISTTVTFQRTRDEDRESTGAAGNEHGEDTSHS